MNARWTTWAVIMEAPDSVRAEIEKLLPAISRGFSNVEFKMGRSETVVQPGGSMEHNVPAIFYRYKVPPPPHTGNDHERFKAQMVGYLQGWFHARGVNP